jgi:flagellar biosynthesis chaperone FliJ
MSLQVLQEMSAAHLENVKREITKLRNQQEVVEEEINKLIQYYEVHSKLLEDSFKVPVE